GEDMTSVRRLLPFGTFAALAAAWWAVNSGLYDASVAHVRAISDAQLAAVNARQLAAGRPLLEPIDPSYFSTSWSVHWQTLAPGLLLLGGAAVFAALLRRSV